MTPYFCDMENKRILLSEDLIYDPVTGRFYRNGKRAERPHSRGYLYVVIEGKLVLAHRAAWIAVHGEIPKAMVIDHINREKIDNRIANLRAVSQSNNTANAKLSSVNTSGYRGVSKRGSKWQAYINLDGKRKHLGYYESPEEAYKAHVFAARKQWGDAYNGANADPSFTLKLYNRRGRPSSSNPKCPDPHSLT